MKLQRMRRMLGFPLDNRCRDAVEIELFMLMSRPLITVAGLILVFQAIMMLTSILRGGPFISVRRQIYWWLYVTLFVVTSAVILYVRPLRKRCSPRAARLFLRMQTIYAAIIVTWATVIAALDQISGNGISVYIYVSLSVAALTLLQPWQSIIIFLGTNVLLNTLLFTSGYMRENLFSNVVNSAFITVMACVVSTILYRSRIHTQHAHLTIERQNEEITEMNRQLNQLAITDELTGMNNRRYLDQLTDTPRWKAAHNICVLMLDIDYFKQYNDRFGHVAGDICLITISAALRSALHDEDAAIVRYGGEEFFICLFNTTSNWARQIAQRLLLAVRNCEIPQNQPEAQHVTVSIGLCIGTLPAPDENLQTMLKKADDALYKAKGAGRNQVVEYEE